MLRGTVHLVMGIMATVLFFGSIIVRELSRTLRALREGVHVSEITLSLFGGVSRAEEPLPTPSAELRVVPAGSLASGCWPWASGPRRGRRGLGLARRCRRRARPRRPEQRAVARVQHGPSAAARRRALTAAFGRNQRAAAEVARVACGGDRSLQIDLGRGACEVTRLRLVGGKGSPRRRSRMSARTAS